ncbi:DUF3299 domain-containing protein [Colwellia psychrerythraea]|uniref:Lipoprotein n=1 Tax=Colwellia psychrerythraea TaxID=28229 RepID=A0A099KGZ5_COLPS|nr:DUF3299 domain-containing protein [Colwellia psychrerythraea]KGJ89591.1 Protein of unknown function DUF3299 [Colwellia psychrerythraea]
MKFSTIWFCFFVILGCKEAQPIKGVSTERQVVISVQLAQPLLPAPSTKAILDQYETIEWIALIPEADLDALLNPPDYIVNVADGSMEDEINSSIQSSMNPIQESDGVYEQALNSTNIIDAMDGRKIRIPGFVVPVGFTDEQRITSFFLVPYFGACLHMPPPPPNQIIYIKTDQGFDLESIYEPVWVSGMLSAEKFEDPMATSAYSMDMVNIKLYYEDKYQE